jgi:hypothetical protein
VAQLRRAKGGRRGPYSWPDQIARAMKAATTRSVVNSSTPEFVVPVADILHRAR